MSSLSQRDFLYALGVAGLCWELVQMRNRCLLLWPSNRFRESGLSYSTTQRLRGVDWNPECACFTRGE